VAIGQEMVGRNCKQVNRSTAEERKELDEALHKAARQVNALDAAIKALSGLNSTGARRGRRTMSAAARARISASQKARWARARGQKVVSIAPKRHIPAAGLARIRAAQRARSVR